MNRAVIEHRKAELLEKITENSITDAELEEFNALHQTGEYA